MNDKISGEEEAVVQSAEERMRALGDTFEEISVQQAGKRCGVQWTPWMGDWFTSWSPRNGNNHAEGYWDHWVDLAIKVLQDPLTAIVRPEAHEAARALESKDYYDDCDRRLTPDELMARLAPTPADDTP